MCFGQHSWWLGNFQTGNVKMFRCLSFFKLMNAILVLLLGHCKENNVLRG